MIFMLLQCTTAYFEGTLALIDPQKSWVAKWQRSTKNYPGLYAIEVAGSLPEDAMDYCENMGFEYKSKRT
ncbi:hypothetical protein EON64_07015 [archaeon]|nr:MAG: hypothetical protein EON64_07015 [archaeon]